MRDQRLLPRPRIWLALSDPAGHQFGRDSQTNDHHAIHRDRVDHALQLELGLGRRGHQEQGSARGALQRDDGRELREPVRTREPRPPAGELLRFDRPKRIFLPVVVAAGTAMRGRVKMG
jgi:hypothetical protein